MSRHSRYCLARQGDARILLLVAILGLLIAVAIIRWRWANTDPLQPFDTFPHTYIRVSDAGYDVERVVVVRGRHQLPSVNTDAGTAWPAYVCPDAGVVPQKDGKPYIFPLIESTRGNATTPPLPPGNQPLSKHSIRTCVPYRTAEGQQILNSCAKVFTP